LDAGNLQLDTFSFGQLRLGSGVGLRYITPVGPVNFDWGFKIKPLPSESSNVFYFSLGVI
jgi:outer membrane translocation and assembly module TamA